MHIIDHEHRKRVNVIQLLNSMGYNIVHIDNTYYVISNFIYIQDGIYEIELVGKNITDIIENRTETTGVSNQFILEISNDIDSRNEYRRQFDSSTQYIKYLSNAY